MKKKFLSLLVLLSVPVGVLSATTTVSNYETSKKQTNIYITRFTMYDNYIETGSSVPYLFNGTNSIRSGFTNGGLINKKEVELSTIKNDSYLFTGASYFTMTEEGSNVYDVNINKINLVAKTEESGTRVTELIKPNTKVTGSGSRNNPWMFIRKYKISFNGNTSTSGRMDTITCDSGSNCTLPANAYSKVGYTFEGWSLNPNDTVVYGDKAAANITNIPSDNVVVLYAKWKANNYNVVFDGNNHSSGATAAVTCTYNEDCTLPSNGFSRTGYTFKGWSTTKDGSIKYENNGYVRNLTPVKDATVTLYAVWEANTYTVKFDKNSSEATGNVGSVVCTYDKACTLPANNYTRVGATFDGWAVTSNTAVQYKDKASVKNLTATANGTYTLYAHWNINTYKITYNYGGGSAGNYHPSSVKYGEVINISNPTRSCYSFRGWTISGYNSTYAKSGSSSTNVNTAIRGTTSATYFKNLATNGTVTFTANWGSYSCGSPSYGGNSGGGYSGGSHSSGGSSSGGSSCDTRCQMEKNSAAWHNASSQAEKDRLKAENQRLKNDLPECSGGCTDKKGDGRLTDSKGNCVYTGVAKTC